MKSIFDKKKSILVVDDDADICSTLVDIFNAEGYATDIAYNAGAAIEKIQKNNFDILLTDSRMESVDGLHLIKKVTQINPKIIIFMMTAYPRDSRISEAYNSGVVKIFEKPFEVKDMLEIFKKEIAKRNKKN
ncbi:MAG: response regulator [Candidatus Omnitrophica bacterium]|jgi:DNA-binding NtrC family response regulator|nr:response regulator [Candidatus Omnitrophota bacterium]